LEAFEKNSTQEYAEVERKLEAARVYSGEVTVQLEDAKRLVSESDARIIALTAERNSLRDTAGSAEQEALTWQQIAEEQTETIQRLQIREQELTALLEQRKGEEFETIQRLQTREQELTALLEQRSEEYSTNIASQIAANKNLYETALENLKAQLQEERIEHQQTLESYITEHEQTVLALEEQITKLRTEFDKQVVEVKQNTISLGKDERLVLVGKISHLLQRVELALVENEM
jgi:chromosome segregation ATPase